MTRPLLQQFYINEEQSLYLMSHEDAQKIKDWVQLCMDQLNLLGFSDIEFIGKGAYGFVFAGRTQDLTDYVFKFSRINLPQAVQDRLEEEAWMQSQVLHPHIPAVSEYTRISKQSVLMMERAAGMDLEAYSLKVGRLPPRLVIKIAAQLVEVLGVLRQFHSKGEPAPIVHGDIKPSNIVFDPQTEAVKLIDWGSSVFAQLDAEGQTVAQQGTLFFHEQAHQTNAKLGDVYFIGEEQLNGALSSPRFDEQGLAGTLYALASGQSCRYGYEAIPATALGLPKAFALTLQTLLAGADDEKRAAGDYLMSQMAYMKKWVITDLDEPAEKPLIPIWTHSANDDMESVVYTSRKSFLREAHLDPESLFEVKDVELEKYYKNFMHGMGKTERAFLCSVSRLGKYPVLGGMAVRWQDDEVYIDSSLNLHNPELKQPFIAAANTLVTLSRAIHRKGVFKCCFFDAKNTLHLQRQDMDQPFIPPQGMEIPFEVTQAPLTEDNSRNHSYFEDGDDPDEQLQLPATIMQEIRRLNDIRHTGLIIFESLPTHLKIHNYYVLLDPSREEEFSGALQRIVTHLPDITGLGVSGFMKMPYKNTRQFSRQASLPERYYPKNPKTVTA
ncbi:Serine-threonine protein kinase [Nitrincola lacisaponensis]|uniref:Serine-threonine protein kinase n=1 Tax=Nitrincola lacisaponensis TaxID=267850 RepID=A0A063Y0M5_9GAMM|nr:protein kinase [Nitrincola lacisaponensis]KDE39873.1 Serine-threonine protein kinase [Nitrincola lacisaponensis]